MIIFPAIDIQGGECVRLTRGDFSTAERVAEDPVQTALSFKEAGAEWLHMVDLDGAKSGQMQNRDVFIAAARRTEMKIQLGGGIRDMKTASYYLENGIERIIVGSLAVRNPKLVAEMVREFGDRIIVGIDAENGMVKIDGWLGAGKVSFLTLAREMAYIGVRHVIYTDISRDGTLSGPNLGDLKRLRDGTGINIIASGGISGIDDIRALADLRIYGAICGKSLYRQTLSLEEALKVGAASIPVEPTDEVPELSESGSVSRGAGASRTAAPAARGGGKPEPSGRKRPPKGSGAPSQKGGTQKAGHYKDAPKRKEEEQPRRDARPDGKSKSRSGPPRKGSHPSGGYRGGKPKGGPKNG